MGLIDCLFVFFNLKKFAVNPKKKSITRPPFPTSSISSDAPLESLDIPEHMLSKLYLKEIQYEPPIIINYKVVNKKARISVFPILRLPLLALKHCLRVMEPFELVDFSFCSKATRDLVKTIKIKPETFLVEFDKNSGITLTFKEFPGIKWIFTANRNIAFEEDDIVETRETDGYKYYTTRRTEIEGPQVNNLLVTHWKHTRVGLTKWVEHFVYIIHSPITYFTFYYNYYLFTGCAEILDWFFQMQSNVDDMHFMAYSLNNDVANTGMTQGVTPRFLRYFGCKNMFNTEKLNVTRGDWLTIENILDMSKCKNIQIRRSSISDEDLNIFIRSWINCNYPKLECFMVSRNEKSEENVDKGLIVNGTNFEELDSDTLRLLEQDEKLGIPVNLLGSGGCGIRNKDGVMGSCLMGDNEGSHTFIFYVWTNGYDFS